MAHSFIEIRPVGPRPGYDSRAPLAIKRAPLAIERALLAMDKVSLAIDRGQPAKDRTRLAEGASVHSCQSPDREQESENAACDRRAASQAMDANRLGVRRRVLWIVGHELRPE